MKGFDLSHFQDLQIVEEDIPADAPTVVLLDDAARVRGRAASHVPEVVVYKNFSAGRNNQTALFFNWASTSGGSGDPDCPGGPNDGCFAPAQTVPGIFHADGAVFGGGYQPGASAVSSYEIFAYRDASDPETQDRAFVSMELWDGDPLNAFDSTGAGECIGGDNLTRVYPDDIQGSCKTDADCNIADPGLGGICSVHFTAVPIPGTKVTFSRVPVNTKIVFRAELDPPVVTPHGRVWVVVTSDACRFGWMLSLNSPYVGSDDNERLNALTGSTNGGFEFQLDSDGATNGLGVCCGDDCDGAACDLDGPEGPCCDDPEGMRNMCVDGDAEDATLGTLEGTCSGDPTSSSDNCANFWLNVYAQAAVTMSVVPTGTGALGKLTPGARIEGNEIILPSGGHNVLLELRTSNFAPQEETFCIGGENDGAPCSRSSEVADCELVNPHQESFGCGIKLKAWQINFSYPGSSVGLAGSLLTPVVPCLSDSDCAAALGGACSFTGERCTRDSHCPLGQFGETCGGTVCSAGACERSWINPARSDYVFNGRPGFLACDNTFFNFFRCQSAVDGLAIHPPDPFPADGLYLAEFVVAVSDDAAGSFSIDLGPIQSSLLLDAQNQFIDLLGFESAKITVETGQCCDISVNPGTCLGGQVSVTGCTALGKSIGADVEFNTANTCANACPRCPVPAAPRPEPLPRSKNRYLSFRSDNAGTETAIQVTFVDLPPPHDVANGRTMWLGPPETISEHRGNRLPADAPGFPTFVAAALQCEPFVTDWGALGTINVYHEGIIPGAAYDIREIGGTCDPDDLGSFSTGLRIATSRWGDLVGHCAVTPCSPPNGVVDVAFDIIALIDKLSTAPGALSKPRADLQPSRPDQIVNIIEVTRALDAFAGARYPFAGPGAIDPCVP